MQLDLPPSWPVQASQGQAPKADELDNGIHFTFYAFESDSMVGRLFEVQKFEVHRIVDLSSPCFIDVGPHVPFPGLHVSQYAAMMAQATGITDLANPPPGATEQQKIDAATAVQREGDVALLASDSGIKVVSSASNYSYPPVAVDCIGPGIPPPTCIDTASNQRRLQQCQDFWHSDPNYFEGTDRVLTSPLNGVTHGMVDGENPINLAPVGGAQFYVDSDLAGFTTFAIYYQVDGMPEPGNLLVYGHPTMVTRGVMHVHMTSPTSPTLSADAAIFANLDQDNTSF
ncbi:MAG: hypothetical protein ACM31C_27235 [Acidobacteriota bacterium]